MLHGRDSLCGVHRTIVTLSRTRRLILLKNLARSLNIAIFFQLWGTKPGSTTAHLDFRETRHAFSVAFLDHNGRFYEGSDF
jgi:hypothetical protein